MPTHVRRRAAQALTSLGLVTALFVALPVALVAGTRARFGSSHPLGGATAPWTWDLGATLEAPLADGTVVDIVVRTALLVAWSALGVLAVSTVAEVLHLRRHRGVSSPPVRGAGWAQGLARYLAAGLVAIAPLTSTGAAGATRTPLARISVDAAFDGSTIPTFRSSSTRWTSHESVDVGGVVRTALAEPLPPPAPPPTAASAVAAAQIHLVQPGESVYGIAEDLAGRSDLSVADIADAILDANLGTVMPGGSTFTTPAYIEVGWELVIPSSVTATLGGPGWSPPSTTASTTDDARTIVVERGDTLSDIADEHLGDASRWPTIWAANAGREMPGGRTFDDPHLILPGWPLDVPVPAPPDLDEPDALDEDLATADQDDSETDTAVTDTADTDTVDITPVDIAPVDIAPVDPDPEPAASTVLSSPSPSTTTARPSATVTPDSTTVPSTTDAVPDAVPSLNDTGNDAPPTAADADTGSMLRLEHAAMLAAGALAMVGVRRRQRLRRARPRTRVPAPHADVAATERRLRTAHPGERSTRVDVGVRAVAHALVDTDVQIGLVAADADGLLVVYLTAPATLPAPWTPVDGVTTATDCLTWQLDASVPIELLSQDARNAGLPCHALVQLGVANGADLLVDLEACGALAIEAPAAMADPVVAGLAAGLATSPYAEVAHLVTVAAPDGLVLGHRNAHRAPSVRQALEIARSLVGSTAVNLRTSFSLRASHTGGEAWEPAVVLLTSQDRGGLEALTEVLPAGGHGLAVVASVEPETWHTAPVRLVWSPDGWTFVGFRRSMPVVPVGLDDLDSRRLRALLDDASAPLIDDPVMPRVVAPRPTAPVEIVRSDVERGDVIDDSIDIPDAIVLPPHRHTDALGTEHHVDDFVPLDHRVLVRLFGGVEVCDADGTPGRFERSKTTELIAWLATHREQSTRSNARTALWEQDVRDATFSNIVSEARRGLARLVAPPDGEEWVGRTLTDRLPLHPLVVTDAQLVAERLDAARTMAPAQAIATLRPAAELLRGMPFAGTTYLWPDTEGLTSNLVLLATGVVVELAEHALSVADIDLVFWATGRGLGVLAGQEELIGLRMRAHARAGDLAGVRQEWESYERVLVADAWSDGEPSPKLLALRRDLLS